MPELRKDPIVNRWVIIAKNRAQRPQELDTRPDDRRAADDCPFCAGNEAATPHEICAFRQPGTAADSPGWRVRVVPNKFPAVESRALDFPPLGAGQDLQPRIDGLYESLPAFGAHEVIIESPDHLLSTTDLDHDRLCEVLLTYRDRLLALKQDQRLRYAMLFKNKGAAAGASIEHTHSQLVVLPMTPTAIQEELDGALAFERSRKACVFCELVRQESARGERIVLDMPGFMAFCPFASRFPFETWIIPKAHHSHFESITRGDADALAVALKQVIGRIEAALDHPAYNYMIHTAPFDTFALGHYHWHIEITPRLTKIAGFEWGTGCYINPAPPEEAAALLRSVKVDFTMCENVPIKKSG